MTVTTTLDRQYFDGDGSNKVFPFNFRFFTNDQIYVSLIAPDGTITLQSLTTNYTLAGALQAGGGTVTMIVAPPLTVPATRVFVQRIIPQVQPTSIRNQGKFYPEIHEDVFDRLTMLIQQALAGLANALQLTFSKTGWNFLGYKGINVGTPTDPTDAATKGYVDASSQGNSSYTDSQILRTVRGGSGEALTQLPPAASRANKVMGFDSSGQPIGLLPASGSGTELAIDLANVTDPSKGAGMVGWKRNLIADAIKLVSDSLNGKSINIWEFAHLASGYTPGGNISTWDWAPAINAASASASVLNIGVVEFTAHRFNITTTIRRIDGVSFRGRGSFKRDTSGATLNDVTTIVNSTNANIVMESQGKTSGQKNIIAHMQSMKIIGNVLTTVVLDLKGFWLSKFDECFIGGGLTTVWGHSDVPNGYNCYYCQITNSIVSGLNPNNYDNTPNVYGIRLTDLVGEFYMDGVNILNATNALSIESGSYCHAGYVNVEYSSVNAIPIFIDAPASVISDLRCDPHLPMSTPLLQLGPNSRNNRVNLKTFENERVGELMKYYVTDLGRLNEVHAGQYFADYDASRNLIANPNFIETSSGVNYGWTKSNVSIAPDGFYNTFPVTKIALTSALNLAGANCLVEIPVAQLSLGNLIVLDLLIKVSSPAALLGFSDSSGFFVVDGSISGNILTVPNTGGTFQRVRRAFFLTTMPVSFLRLNIYPCRSSTVTVTPTIGDSVSVCAMGVDIIDPYSRASISNVVSDGTQPMLSDLVFRKPGSGIVLTTPDGAHTYRISISNAGAVVLTQIT